MFQFQNTLQYFADTDEAEKTAIHTQMFSPGQLTEDNQRKNWLTQVHLKNSH